MDYLAVVFYQKKNSMAINYKTVNWANGATLYEVNVRQFTPDGTLNAFKHHLPRLQKMGVKILWFMPLTPIAKELRQGSLGSYYACSSYTKMNEEFGTLQDFKELVKEAHALNMKVIIDWVANHTGYAHEWTVNKDWYVLDNNGNFTEENGWHDVIDLNYSNANMRKAMMAAMQFWIKECDIDGFRCDMAHLVPLNFWEDVRTTCDTIKPLFWLAECDEAEYLNVFDASYAWKWMHTTEKLIKNEAIVSDVYHVLHEYTLPHNNAKKLFYTTNHDENSWNGTEFEKYGNSAKTLAVFCFTWHGMPLLYSGQEAANTKRLQFFDKDLIDWSKGFVLENFYEILIKLAHKNIVTNGETFILPTTHNKVMAYLRKYQNEVLLVLLNFSNEARIKTLVQHHWLQGTFTNIFSELQYSFNEKEVFELQANEYLLYWKK